MQVLPRSRPLLAMIVALAALACDVLPPASVASSPAPTEVLSPPAPGAAGAIACIDIQPLECSDVVARILAGLPGEQGNPFAIQILLGGCVPDVPACPRSLAARRGQAIVEYPDGGDVLVFEVTGPPNAPVIEPVEEVVFTDPIQPGSQPVEGAGPFEYEVGHCGLRHVVDFNGAFWVLAGQLSGEHPALGNAEQGIIRLQNLDRAQYVGTQNEVFQLVRFPGAKRFQLCD